jgi:transposase, IS5 family
MIEMRRAQLSFGDGLIAEEVSDLREDWMKHADAVLADGAIVAAVYEALARRHAKSRSRGRHGAPAEVVLRLLILKHIRNWSYQVLEREVRANLVYRDFTRVGAGKMPDAKTMGRWGVAVGPEVVKQIHQRLVKLAQANGLAAGRRMRVDTTVVETNVHYPTDSSLLGDGVRVLIRTMKRIGKIAGETGAKLRDRSRSVKLRVLDIARAARSRAKQAGRGSIDPTASCSMRPAAWWDRRSGSPKRSPEEPSAQGASCSSWCSKACARSSTRWCRWSSK